MVDENEVLKRYSTAGLRKFELDRMNKKDQLYGMKMDKAAVDVILEELYGPEEKKDG